MSKKYFAYLFLLFFGVVLGLCIKETRIISKAFAQESGQQTSEKQIVRGTGRASTSWRVPNHVNEPITLFTSPHGNFSVVPKGKNYVVTDVVFQTQGGVRQSVVVNISLLEPTRKSATILFQTTVEPDSSKNVSFCTGYVIPSGYSLVAYTGAGYEPEQYVSISISGYLEDAK